MFPGTLYPAGETRDSEVPVIKIPRADGGVALTGTLQPKTFKLRGGLTADQAGVGDVRTAIDALAAALKSGPANLYFDNDRFWRNVQSVGMSVGYEGSWYPRIATIELDLITPDPFQYSTAGAATDSWPTSSGIADPTLVVGIGQASVAPYLTPGTYYAAYTFTNANGETNLSPLNSVTIGSNNNVTLDGVALETGATGVNFYFSEAVNSTTLKFLTSNGGGGPGFDVNALPAGGAASPPGSNTTGGLSGTHIITYPTGTAYTWPVFTINLSAAAAIDVTLANTATGESFTIDGDNLTTQWVVRSDTQVVTDSGGTSYIALWDGVFPRLQPGSNPMTLTLNGAQGAAITSVVTSWLTRWY